MTLTEIAGGLDVKTFTWESEGKVPRPSLDIAMEIQSRLPVHDDAHPNWSLLRDDCSHNWSWSWGTKTTFASGEGTFEEAVIALAEKYLE